MRGPRYAALANVRFEAGSAASPAAAGRKRRRRGVVRNDRAPAAGGPAADDGGDRARARRGRRAGHVGAQSRRILDGAELSQSVSSARAGSRGTRPRCLATHSRRSAGSGSGATSVPRSGAKHRGESVEAWAGDAAQVDAGGAPCGDVFRRRRGALAGRVAGGGRGAFPVHRRRGKRTRAHRRAGGRGHAPGSPAAASAMRELRGDARMCGTWRRSPRTASASSSSAMRSSSKCRQRTQRSARR